MKFPGRQVISVLLPLFTLPFSLFATGCSTPATLTVRSTERKCSYAQTFSQAFASHTEDGTHEFILVADDAIRSAPKETGGPLQPVEKTPLRQVVYIRVLWQPLTGIEPGVGTNASIDWFVFGDTAGSGNDMLEYQGTAMARIDVGGKGATKVTLREGTLKPRAARGTLTDPIGVGRLSGTFTAVNNPARVQELLAAARARTADASADAQ
ncbi:MAG: hypothetical protein ABIP55_14595 [Tepidisphaeraceae bacterium]